MFSKDIKKVCAYCIYGSDYLKDTVLCKKHGPVSDGHHCRKFRYDPLRRTPPPASTIKTTMPDEAFKLE